MDAHDLALAALATVAQRRGRAAGSVRRFDSSGIPEPGPRWAGLRGPSDKESDTGKEQDEGPALEMTQKQGGQGQMINDAP